MCFPPLIQRGNSGRPSAMPNYFGFYGRVILSFYDTSVAKKAFDTRTGGFEGGF